MPIAADRIKLALEQLSSVDGHLFESFANESLAGEYPNLRPIAGLHDEGRDAFLFKPDDEPNTFVQHSVTTGISKKISQTIDTLKQNGHKVTILIYCTPHSFNRTEEAKELKKKFRKDGISVDIRDREDFIARANETDSATAAAENLSKLKVDPLLAESMVSKGSSLLLTSAQESAILAYFQISFDGEDSDKSVTRLALESLVMWALRQATPEAPLSRAELHKEVARFCPGTDNNVLADRINGILERWNRKKVKHHQKLDAFTLEFVLREANRTRFEALAVELTEVKEVATAVAENAIKDLKIDYPTDASAVGADAFSICQAYLYHQSMAAAKALDGLSFFSSDTATLVEIAEQTYQTKQPQLKCAQLTLEKFMDCVPVTAQRILESSNVSIKRQLTRIADAYCLLFALRQVDDIQDALRRFAGGLCILLDTSILVPCLCEIHRPKEEKRMTNLLGYVRQLGATLYVTDECVTELMHTIRTSENVYEGHVRYGSSTAHSELATEYLKSARHKFKSYWEFVQQFVGTQPEQDLRLLITEELQFKFEEFKQERDKINLGELSDIFAVWKARRKRRAEEDETVLDGLIHNDARSLLLTCVLRSTQTSADAKYRQKWWWLTRDRNAYAVDESRRKPGEPSVCISPDFLFRYMTMLPTKAGLGLERGKLAPMAIEVASLGFVPEEVTAQVSKAVNDTTAMLPYMRIRKIREGLKKIMSA
jgi:hypothetical protein